MGRWLVIMGLAFIVTGLLWGLITRRFGRLPGDFVFRVGDARIHILLATSLLLSVVLSLLLWIMRR